MMRAILFAILCAAITLDARADPWSTADTAREVAFFAVVAVDWAQTRDIVRRPGYHERNPILGRRPNGAEVDRYFFVSMLFHAGAAALLPAAWREAWQLGGIVIEARAAARNQAIGLRAGSGSVGFFLTWRAEF